MPNSDLDLDAIRRRVPNVYAGPWTVQTGDHGDDNWYVNYATNNPLAGLVATVPDYGANLAEFIAHAREDVPALLAEVERLRQAEAATAKVVNAARAWRAEASELFGDLTDKLLISAVDKLAEVASRPSLSEGGADRA